MADNTDITKGLSGILDQDLIKTDPDTLSRFAVDLVRPRAVLFPTGIEQIAETVRHANRENLALVPWGSGTKMAQGLPPSRLDLVVSTSRLNHMKDVDAANLTITVETGVKFRDIQARLATEEDRCYLPLGDLEDEEDDIICSDRTHSGCFLPLDPPSSKRATIGGIIATNACGPRRLLYGLPRDIVLGVRFVSPEGTIVGAGGKTVKNVSGYDISKMMIGSMGSLGILCDMTLRLLPLPEKMETLLTSFGSFDEASAFVNGIFETKLLPAAVELMNGRALDMIEAARTDDFHSGDFIVAVALEAFSEAVDRMRSDIQAMAARSGVKTQRVVTEGEHLRFWLAVSDRAQKTAEHYPAAISLKLNYPLSRWEAVIRRSDEALGGSKIPYTLEVHTGSGIGLVSLLLQDHHPSDLKQAVKVLDKLFKNCREKGGNVVVQGAPSGLKETLPVWGEPAQDWAVMKRLKKQLDPAGVMSPGRFVGGL